MIEASRVNREWNKLCAESQQVAKLKLVFNNATERRMNKSVVEMLKNSKRRFQNIEISHVSLSDPGFLLSIFADGAGSWKSVESKFCKSFDGDAWYRILQIIEPTVEELSVVQTQQRVSPIDADPMWTFPCLKSLEVNVHEFNLFKYFVNCTSLVKLCWQSDDVGPAVKQSMLILLRNSRGLKELNAESDGRLLAQPFEFKLQKLRISVKLFELNPENIAHFLQSQAETLESLTILAKLDQACLKLILSQMPRLSSLTIDLRRIEKATSNDDQELPKNMAVTTLELKETHQTEAQSQIPFQKLIAALPNLKHYKSSNINDEELRSLAQHVPTLESLVVDAYHVSRFPDRIMFPKLKKFKARSFYVQNLERVDFFKLMSQICS